MSAEQTAYLATCGLMFATGLLIVLVGAGAGTLAERAGRNPDNFGLVIRARLAVHARRAAHVDRIPRVTGDERLAKVAEVLHDHGLCVEVPTATTDAHEHRVATCHRYTQALAPLLDEFRAEDEARALREAADAWQRGQWTAITAKVKERNVLGTAQIVGDWIRARTVLGDEREAGR